MGEVPGFVKFLAVLNYLGAALNIILGITLLFSGGLISLVLSSLLPSFSGILTSIGLISGIFLIALGVLSIFIGRGLWTGKNWARVVSIILYAIGAIISLYSITLGSLGSIVLLLIYLGFGGYLAFSKKVKEAFTTSVG